MLAYSPNHFFFPWAQFPGSGALPRGVGQSSPSLLPGGYPVSYVPVDQELLGSVGAAGFLAGAQASTTDCEQESNRADL